MMLRFLACIWINRALGQKLFLCLSGPRSLFFFIPDEKPYKGRSCVTVAAHTQLILIAFCGQTAAKNLHTCPLINHYFKDIS